MFHENEAFLPYYLRKRVGYGELKGSCAATACHADSRLHKFSLSVSAVVPDGHCLALSLDKMNAAAMCIIVLYQEDA